MDGDEEYRFTIAAYSPETMPMARLAEYLAQLAAILGEEKAVHFVRLDPGSTDVVHRVEREAVPKVRSRAASVRRGDGPSEARLQKARTKIVIPSPALSELLVRAGAEASQRLVEEIGKSSVFRIVAFDALAAIEVAAMTRQALESGDKRGGVDGVWAKIKYDRQIVAIARVLRATAVYSCDAGIKSLGERLALNVVGIADLPLPAENPQIDMFDNMSPDEAEIAAAEIAAQTEVDPLAP